MIDHVDAGVRTTCRVCGSTDLHDVLSLGLQYLSDFVPAERIGSGRAAPLDVVLCDRCGLFQLRHTARPEAEPGRPYWYRSGIAGTTATALAGVTSEIQQRVRLGDGDVVLDIGANDGTLLASYATPGLIRVGCDPAGNVVDALSANADHVISAPWSWAAYERLTGEHGLARPRVITAIDVFYDLHDPGQFIRDVALALADGGLFVAQMTSLRRMLEHNDVGNVCHEHEYYSPFTLGYLFEQNGLEIFEIEENDINGGSLRVFARHAQGTGLALTDRIGADDVRAFARRIEQNRDACVAFIRAQVALGKLVYAYGASIRGNVVLQYYGLDGGVIAGVADRSGEKVGLYTVGSWIPIVSEAEARAAQPDFFLVLPWAYLEEFSLRERDWLLGGGRFIVQAPAFRVVP